MIAMKRYFYILLVGVLFSLTSCVQDDFFVDEVYAPNANSGLQIIGIAEDYDKVNVSTRANGEQFADSRITEMTMFIFKENGSMIQGYNANQLPISSAVNIRKPNPTFLINASEYNGTGIIASMDVGVDIRYYNNTEADLDKCSIYIVANAYHHISHLVDGNDQNGEIRSLDDLNNAILNIDATLSMPKDANKNYIGFPMIGTHEGTFNLSYSSTGAHNDVANIPLKKVYSKILFTMQVNAKQVVVGGPTPKFTIDRAEVYNVPTKARLGKYTGDYIDKLGDNYQFEFVDGDPNTDYDKPFVISGSAFSNPYIYHTTSKDLLPGSSDLIEFGFYMPEHMVTPKSPFGYPANIPDNLKQYYKPKGVEGQKATFVRIHGSYTDHNGYIKKVSFDIYLGQNHTDSFEVRRNQQLTNKITITGITNHNDAYGDNQTNISVDHRVNVSDQGYNLYMEREAILDAHFEVRPIDIELQWGSSMTIVIPTSAQSWIALEGDDAARSGKNPNLYVDNDNPTRGVRKYFTSGLVGELNGENQGTITLRHSSCYGGENKNTEYFRVWFYFDENPNVYDQNLAKDASVDGGDYTISDKLYRMEPVKFYYSQNATELPNTQGEPIQVINFQQWNLWRVWNKEGNRYYDIEHEEEYLNNYASNDGYGPEQNGMAWGLDGLQLSHEHDAAVISQSDLGLLTRIINWIGSYSDWTVESLAQEAFKNLPTRPLYDFYLLDDTSETALERHDNAGLHFNEEILSVLLTTYKDDPKAKINGVQLHQKVNSAIAYCYNKNKRDSDGNVCTINSDGTLNSTNLKWFLPSIDQIEDIVAGAYAEFDGVFQNNMYWSCQPAYEKHRMDLDTEIIILTILNESTQFGADYYTDNVSRARATKSKVGGVVNGEVQYVAVGSGVPDISGTQGGDFVFRYRLFGGLSQTFDIPASKYVPNGVLDYSSESVMGNMPRSANARIRAVYRSGTGTKPTK